MRKKILTLVIFLLVAITASFPAQAATKISNGVPCAKLSTTSKVGTSVYICSNGTVLNITKLVWLSKNCVDAAKQYYSAKAKFDQLNASADKANKATMASIESVKSKIQLAINRMILWKPTKVYMKDDVVYQQNDTYYVSLTSKNSGKMPTENLGTDWMVYKPTAGNAKVGTSPDVDSVILWKQRDVSKWTSTLDRINKDIKALEAITKPTAADTKNLKTLKTLSATFTSGIAAGNKNISTMQSYVKELMTQNSLLAAVQAQSKLIEANRADVTQLRSAQTTYCAKGK